MTQPIPFALTGYLDTAPVHGETMGSVSWRLISSPADCTVEEEALIPCSTSLPDLAHTLLTECQPGDLLRVTGHLTLPGTADSGFCLDADHIEILWEAPLAQPKDEPEADDHNARNRAILGLAEALTSSAYQRTPGEQPDIRIIIGPVGINDLDVAHCHSIDVTTARTRQLADAVDAMCAMLGSQPPPEHGLDPLALADLLDHFDGLDLTALTQAVLATALPENRIAVTRAVDDLLGDIPVPDSEISRFLNDLPGGTEDTDR
ncbi:hypothetical protein ACFU96_44945 [Streptomyces sp. NPDC057620]|uniref:hypothetical protein n=1 Tax=Streptomyces sp. NPDC057620 TaxID=3346185 RepID=UPI0036C327F7